MTLTPHRRIPSRVTHGTQYAYREGCRCDACRARAAAIRLHRREWRHAYMAGYRERNREKLRARNREWMRQYRATRRAAA